MTVLVSAVKEMRARGVPIRAVACASTGDTSRGARGLLRRLGHPLRRPAPAREGLHGPARPAGLERRAGARARHRLRRLHARGAGPLPDARHLPRQLDELAPHRGTEDRRGRGRPAARLDVARLGDHPRREPGQRRRARQGLPAPEGAGARRPAAAARAWRRRRTPTRSTGRSSGPGAPARTSRSTPSRPAPPWRAPSRSAPPSRRSGRCAPSRRSTAWSSRPASRSSPTQRPGPISPAPSPVRTPGWRWRRSRSWPRAGW